MLLVQSRWHCKLNFSLHFSAVYKVPFSFFFSFFYIKTEKKNLNNFPYSHCVDSLNCLKVFPQQHFLSLHQNINIFSIKYFTFKFFFYSVLQSPFKVKIYIFSIPYKLYLSFASKDELKKKKRSSNKKTKKILFLFRKINPVSFITLDKKKERSKLKKKTK